MCKKTKQPLELPPKCKWVSFGHRKRLSLALVGAIIEILRGEKAGRFWDIETNDQVQGLSVGVTRWEREVERLERAYYRTRHFSLSWGLEGKQSKSKCTKMCDAHNKIHKMWMSARVQRYAWRAALDALGGEAKSNEKE